MHKDKCKQLENEYYTARDGYRRLIPPSVDPLDVTIPSGHDLKHVILAKQLMEGKKKEWEEYCKANCD
ncbi:hypothetical protein M1432_00900 [Patescibacteria group bacterium]|nr:hypothetical protein [Patescibacteria group bacterium]